MSWVVRNSTRSAVAFIALLVASTAPAADRFVSTTGADPANDCTSSTAPCATLSHAVSQAASGDTVKVADGVYSDAVYITSSTTLPLVGGWKPDFATPDAGGTKRTILTQVVYLDANGGNTIDVTLAHFTFSNVAIFTGDGTVHASVADSIVNRGALSAIADPGGTLDLAVADSIMRRCPVSGLILGVDGSATVGLTNCELTSNKQSGMQIQTHGTGHLQLDVADSTFKGNRSTTEVSGALDAVSAEDSTLDIAIHHSVFSSNRTNPPFYLPGRGGAVSARAIGSSTLSFTAADSTFSGNRATHGGGLAFEVGVELSPGTSHLSATLTNSVVVGNSVAPAGGAGNVSPPSHGGLYYLVGTGGTLSAAMVDTTVTRNRATGGPGGMGFSASGTGSGTLTLRNTIVYGNKASTAPNLFLSAVPGGSAIVDADHDDLGSVDNDPSLPGTFNDDGGNISADPRLRGGVFLKVGSPAIDAGTCTGAPATDFEGDPRPTGASCDIGADEFVP